LFYPINTNLDSQTIKWDNYDVELKRLKYTHWTDFLQNFSLDSEKGLYYARINFGYDFALIPMLSIHVNTLMGDYTQLSITNLTTSSCIIWSNKNTAGQIVFLDILGLV
jgi:hypothetical protein